jgi:hypothetical protein
VWEGTGHGGTMKQAARGSSLHQGKHQPGSSTGGSSVRPFVGRTSKRAMHAGACNQKLEGRRAELCGGLPAGESRRRAESRARRAARVPPRRPAPACVRTGAAQEEGRGEKQNGRRERGAGGTGHPEASEASVTTGPASVEPGSKPLAGYPAQQGRGRPPLGPLPPPSVPFSSRGQGASKPAGCPRCAAAPIASAAGLHLVVQHAVGCPGVAQLAGGGKHVAHALGGVLHLAAEVQAGHAHQLHGGGWVGG